MKLRNRLLLVAFGVVVFIIATPILVIYARGFKINWTNFQVVKTGAFVIKTLPSKATVYLDDKKQKTQTPDTIRFLIPKDYNVRIEKDGYMSWTKRLPINSQFATWINQDRDFITLFLQRPETVATTQINYSSLSEDGTELAYLENSKLNIYNINNGSIQNLDTISSFRIPLTFSGNLVWLNGLDVFKFFQTHNLTTPITPANITKVENNGSFMALQMGGKLYYVNGNNLTLVDNTSGFNLDGDTIWYVSSTNLKTFNMRTNSQSTINSGLPPNSSAQIIRGDGNTFLILDNSLFTLNDTLEKIYEGVNYANYDPDSHLLLFSDNNEILTYNPQTKKSDLILRSISPVSNPVINWYTGYVFFTNENQVKAIELDGRDHRNTYTISPLPEPNSHFIVNRDGSTLTIFNNDNFTNIRIR